LKIAGVVIFPVYLCIVLKDYSHQQQLWNGLLYNSAVFHWGQVRRKWSIANLCLLFVGHKRSVFTGQNYIKKSEKLHLCR
jgi:hypothetical protein